MVHHDHLTKFVLPRALQSKRVTKVAYHFNDIFLTIGEQCIPQSDNAKDEIGLSFAISGLVVGAVYA
ncbi:hypothetical protein KGM_200754 [Danaus plexippus plexippus]|uniref:Uncharacterized protein n=1 Tax=Danaus plexippus plexippus TaxID=278856 RepID=A0A212EXI8_DANPL|nr:hypothetical protein KGM_200754 [Danaus plexippus plexippus]